MTGQIAPLELALSIIYALFCPINMSRVVIIALPINAWLNARVIYAGPIN